MSGESSHQGFWAGIVSDSGTIPAQINDGVGSQMEV
jgi:hypothetical protein